MAKRTGSTPKSRVKRSVYFYLVDVGVDRDTELPRLFDARKVLGAVNRIPENDRDRPWSDGVRTNCWINSNREHVRICVGSIREKDLPRLARNATLMALPLQPGDGLAELIHVVFFEKTIGGRTVVFAASEYNHFGPRISRLGPYLKELLPDDLPVEPKFIPLIEPKVQAQLAKIKDLHVVDLKLRPGVLKAHGIVNRSIPDAISGVADEAHAQEVSLILKSKKEPLHSKVLGFVKNLLKNAGPDLRRLHIRGVDEDGEKTDDIDLLRGLLAEERTFVRLDETSRSVESSSAYSELIEAYRVWEDVIEEAASIELVKSVMGS